MAATFAKLRDGTWGLRGPVAEVVPGATVRVTRRDGSAKSEVVGTIVWRNDEVALATIAAGALPANASPARLERAANKILREAGCGACRRTAARTAQLWEPCDRCGNEPVYR
jgi:hypothetical protein